MATLRVENLVHDFDTWKAVFDKFEQFRAEQGVRAYRLCRSVAEPNRVTVDLDFDSVPEATAFSEALERIWRTPQSRDQMASHGTPEVLDLVVVRDLSPVP